MSVYIPTVPTGRIPLDEDYQNLQRNFGQLDTSFAIDHYAFSSQTNNGFHNKVTTPEIVGGGHPLTNANVPVFYAHAQTANTGVLQFSKGPPVAAVQVAATPVTCYQSAEAGFNFANGATINILNFAGISKAFARFMFLTKSSFDAAHTLDCTVFFDGNTFVLKNAGVNVQVQQAATILQLRNVNSGNLTDCYWTLQLLRVN